MENQETNVQKRRSSIIKTQKNTPVPQASEHTAVDLNSTESSTETDEKLFTEPSPPPAPPVSIFLQTADFLLNVNALVVGDVFVCRWSDINNQIYGELSSVIETTSHFDSTLKSETPTPQSCTRQIFFSL